MQRSPEAAPSTAAPVASVSPVVARDKPPLTKTPVRQAASPSKAKRNTTGMAHWDLARSLARRRKGDFMRMGSCFAGVTFEEDIDVRDLTGPNRYIGQSLSRPSLQVCEAFKGVCHLTFSVVYPGIGRAGYDACPKCYPTHDSSCSTFHGVAVAVVARLWPSNYKECRDAFLESSRTENPQFRYAHPVAKHELQRFYLDTEHLELAQKILDSVMEDYKTEAAYKAALGDKEDAAMTPEQLVKSAEAYLKKSTGPLKDAIVNRLSIHFKRKNGGTGTISVRGSTLNVPLPVTLTASRAEAVWAHELGTHFIRNAVNEPVRKNTIRVAKERQLLPPDIEPIGSRSGWEEHRKRLEWVRENPNDPIYRGQKVPAKTSSPLKKPQDKGGGKVTGASPSKAMGGLRENPSKGSSTEGGAQDTAAAEEDETGGPAEGLTNSAKSTLGNQDLAASSSCSQDSDVDDSGAAGVANGISTNCASDASRMSSNDSVPPPPPDDDPDAPEIPSAAGCACDDEDRDGPLRVSVEESRREKFQQERYEAVSEEGLAIVNQYLHEKDKRLWRPALMYYAAAKGAEMSFVELFEDLGQYVADGARRWAICARVKGGITDTSQHGSFCRDQVYFAGAIEVLRRRGEINFEYMHSGRVLIEDGIAPNPIHIVIENSRKEYTFPAHMDNKGTYLEMLNDLASCNLLTD
eukprot:gene9934-11763_t